MLTGRWQRQVTPTAFSDSLMPRSHWLLTGHVRSLRPMRLVTPKTAELDHNGYVLKWGVYILLLLVELSSLAYLFS